MEIRLKERNEINEKYKWDLTHIYKDEAQWEDDFTKLRQMIDEFTKCKGSFTTTSQALLEALKDNDDINRLMEKMSSYASRRSDQDTRDAGSSCLKDRIISLEAYFGETSSFFEPELLKLTDEQLNTYINENSELQVYHHFLNNIMRFKAHVLPLEEEKMLASATEIISCPSKIFTKLNNADIKFGYIKDEEGNKAELTKGNYAKFITSQSRQIRKKAFSILYKSYKDLKNTFATTLTGEIKTGYFLSKNRKYDNPLAMSLFQNNIDSKVYTNTIDVVHRNLDKLHKYVKMKKKVLGLRSFHMYDFYVDLIKEYDIKYEYDEAVKLVFKALEPLGEDYINNAKKAFDERWIDVYENAGKLSGAYSSLGYDTPPYILLNYNDNLESVGTIIHELGHSMHSYYSSSNQPYIYHGYAIFLAEIASNVNEMLLNMYMFDHAQNTQEKLSLINDFLESVKGSIYRQTMFAEFEKKIYDAEGDNQALTEEHISDIYYNLNKQYYGNDIISDDDIRYEWMRIPHFYYQFYVYQYATGLTAAFFIAKDLYEGKEGTREKYIKFLSSGCSSYPLDLLKQLGIDMTTGEAMQRILDYFDERLDLFNQLINEK